MRGTRSFFLGFFTVSALLIGATLLLFRADADTNRANIAFLREYGWEVDETPEEIVHLSIPDTSSQSYAPLHDVAAASGFDLTPYQGVAATRYSYRVKNHEASLTSVIRANVFVAKDGIIAAHLCELSPDGFLRSVQDKTGQLPVNSP